MAQDIRTRQNDSGLGTKDATAHQQTPSPNPDPFTQLASLTSLTLAGSGLEFTVYRALSPTHGPVALRIPNQPTTISNVNDPSQDPKALLAQELAIYTHLLTTPIPVPTPFSLLTTPDARSAMLASFVPNDRTPPSGPEAGRLLATLHALPPPPGFIPIAQESHPSALHTLAARLPRRHAELTKLRPDLSTSLLPPQTTLLALLLPLFRFPSRLLHMDFRAANLLTERGRVVALVDWENALVGPGVVELFRVLEIGEPGEGFLGGYYGGTTGRQGGEEVSVAEEMVLRLDAAVMLTLVFLSEAPDEELGERWVGRVRELVGRLVGELKLRRL